MCRFVIDEYLQPEYMSLPVTGTVMSEVGISKLPMNLSALAPVSDTVHSIEQSNTVHSIEQINSNVTLVCLLLEGVEKCSAVLGTSFQTELIQVLYPLLVKVRCCYCPHGSDDSIVSLCTR